MFAPASSRLLPTGAGADQYLRTDEDGNVIWDDDNSSNVVKGTTQRKHNWAKLLRQSTLIKIAQTGIGDTFVLTGDQAHGWLRGEIEILKEGNSVPTSLDFGGSDNSATITVDMPIDRVVRSTVVNTSGGQYGAKVDDTVDLYDGTAKQGTITAYIGKDATNGLEVVLVYTAEAGAGTGNITIGATLQLQYEPLGAVLQHAGATGRLRITENTIPTIDNSWDIQTLGDVFLVVKSGDDAGTYVSTITRNAGTTTNTGYGRTETELDASQFGAGVSGTKSYKGYNDSSRTFEGASIGAVGALSTLNSNLGAIMITYDTTTQGNGVLSMVFKTARTYNGTINVSVSDSADNRFTIQLRRVSSTLWQSGALTVPNVTKIIEGNNWYITAPTDTITSVAYSFEKIAGGGAGGVGVVPDPIHSTIPSTINIPIGSTNGTWATTYQEIWRYTNTASTSRIFIIMIDMNARASWVAANGGDRAEMDTRVRVMNSNGTQAKIKQRHNPIYVRTLHQADYLGRYGHTDVVCSVKLNAGQYLLVEGIGKGQVRNSGQSPTPTIQIETDQFDADVQELVVGQKGDKGDAGETIEYLTEAQLTAKRTAGTIVVGTWYATPEA